MFDVETSSALLHIALGFSLASCVGFRVFLPLFVAGCLGRAEYLPLNDSFHFLASTPALIAFGSAVIFEFIGDKIPAVDHALHAVGAVAAPIAGTLSMASVFPSSSPTVSTIVGLIGGGSALVLHTARAHARVASSATTFGFGNIVLSFVEDVLAVLGIALSVFHPIVAAVIAIALLVGSVFFIRAIWKAGRGAFAWLQRRIVPKTQERVVIDVEEVAEERGAQ